MGRAPCSLPRHIDKSEEEESHLKQDLGVTFSLSVESEDALLVILLLEFRYIFPPVGFDECQVSFSAGLVSEATRRNLDLASRRSELEGKGNFRCLLSEKSPATYLVPICSS
jgi:hypothetical protein